jgi:hypothetical protein
MFELAHLPAPSTASAAARSEWRMIAAIHNFLKLHRHTLHTTAA